MDCSQILPGAVNPGPCSLATGYFLDTPFIVSYCYRHSIRAVAIEYSRKQGATLNAKEVAAGGGGGVH